MDIRMSGNLTDTFQIEMYIASEIKSLQHVALDMSNKNTRTLGAGDYPALKFFFIFKSARER